MERRLRSDPAKDMRGDGDLYDYCVDDPVNMHDPNGLWTKETFAESKVKRGDDGKFSGSGGGGASGQSRDPELSLEQAVVIGLGNIPSSFINFFSELWEAVENGDKTLAGIGKMIAGYACQIAGVEHGYRAYSEAVTKHLADRYGSYENVKKTLAEDPVGLVADLSLFFTGGGAALRAAATVGKVSSKTLRAGSVASKIEKTTRVIEKTGEGFGMLGTKTDLLTIPGNIAKKVPVVGPVLVRTKPALGVASPINSINKKPGDKK